MDNHILPFFSCSDEICTVLIHRGLDSQNCICLKRVQKLNISYEHEMLVIQNNALAPDIMLHRIVMIFVEHGQELFLSLDLS